MEVMLKPVGSQFPQWGGVGPRFGEAGPRNKWFHKSTPDPTLPLQIERTREFAKTLRQSGDQRWWSAKYPAVDKSRLYRSAPNLSSFGLSQPTIPDFREDRARFAVAKHRLSLKKCPSTRGRNLLAPPSKISRSRSLTPQYPGMNPIQPSIPAPKFSNSLPPSSASSVINQSPRYHNNSESDLSGFIPTDDLRKQDNRDNDQEVIAKPVKLQTRSNSTRSNSISSNMSYTSNISNNNNNNHVNNKKNRIHSDRDRSVGRSYSQRKVRSDSRSSFRSTKSTINLRLDDMED